MTKLIAGVCLLALCGSVHAQFRPPTATELRQLRSKCAELADAKRWIGAHDEYRYLSSRYDANSGHCYVLVSTGRDDGRYEQYLYEGQTDELLANTLYASKDDHKSGQVYDDKWNEALVKKRGPPRSLGELCPYPPRDPSGAPPDDATMAKLRACDDQAVKNYFAQNYEDAINYIKERMSDQ